MIDNLINKQIEAGMIKEEDAGIFCYGYRLIWEMLLNFIIAILIGIIMNELLGLLIFLLAFIPLRSFAGGYHADKAYKCVILSNLVITVAILAARFVIAVKLPFIILMEIILGAIIYKISPIPSFHKKLCKTEAIRYKKFVSILFLIEVFIEMLVFLLNYENLAYIILFSHIVLTISLVAGKYEKNKLN